MFFVIIKWVMIMKKIILICICFFILTGCQKENVISLKDYYAFIQAINTQQEYKESSTYFNITLLVNKMEDRYRYDVILSHPIEKLSEVKIVCMDNGDEAYFPSLGVYDEPVTLDDYTDKEALVYKGINLSGVVDFQEVVVKILVEFKDEELNLHQEYIELIKRGE